MVNYGSVGKQELCQLIHERLFNECAHSLHAYAKDNQYQFADYKIYRCRKCRKTFSGLAYHEGQTVMPDYLSWAGMGSVIVEMKRQGYRLKLAEYSDGHYAKFAEGWIDLGTWQAAQEIDAFTAVAVAALTTKEPTKP